MALFSLFVECKQPLAMGIAAREIIGSLVGRKTGEKRVNLDEVLLSKEQTNKGN